MDRKQEALEKLRELFPDADNIRISDPVDTMFAIVGEETSTGDDTGQWTRFDPDEGEYKDIDFNYLDETIVASGDTVDEIMESAKHYKRLQDMSYEEYLKEKLEIDDDDSPTIIDNPCTSSFQ